MEWGDKLDHHWNYMWLSNFFVYLYQTTPSDSIWNFFYKIVVVQPASISFSLSSSQPQPPSVTIIIRNTAICHYHHHQNHLSQSSSQPPDHLFLSSSSKPSVTIIITTTQPFLTIIIRNTTTICHYHHHQNHLSLSSSETSRSRNATTNRFDPSYRPFRRSRVMWDRCHSRFCQVDMDWLGFRESFIWG